MMVSKKRDGDTTKNTTGIEAPRDAEGQKKQEGEGEKVQRVCEK